jgi:hypothetical protein
MRGEVHEPPRTADTTAGMDEPVVASELDAAWTFRRRDDRLTIRREQSEQAWQLVVVEGGRSRVFTFTDLARLVVFQHDMEAFLVRTGWSLADFTPDRRGSRDRRGFPRDGNDRRRWWTDVVRDPSL